jgi:hypothetical protein
MGTKRKRPARNSNPAKKPRIELTTKTGQLESSCASHPVLKYYFHNVLTLREYLVSQLALTKSPRGKCLAEYGRSSNLQSPAEVNLVGSLLDTTIIGFNEVKTRSSLHERRAQEIAAFTQQLPSSTLGNNTDPGGSLQIEAVYFVIWLLFRRHQPPAKPQHLLCQGFERLSGAAAQTGIAENAIAGIPGIVYHYANKHVQTLTNTTWCSLLSLLGRGGDLIVIDLLLDCCLFIPVVDGSTGLSQLSGKSMLA